MVARELLLVAIDCELVFRTHYAGIVDQDINMRDVFPRIDSSSGFAYCSKRAEIQLNHANVNV